jgi:formylmethanofuran dehydrogenase subunit E
MNKSIFMILILLITFGFFTKIESEDRIKNVSEQSQVDVSSKKIMSELSPIMIYDEEDLLEISIEDVGKYHGDVCLCLTLAYRAIQFAISQLWQDEISKRGDFKIISACPTPGSKDCFEFITRVITRGNGNDFKLELPQGTDIENMIKDNFTFLFIRKSTSDSIRIRIREGLFSDGFFKLRNIVKYGKTATREEEDNFWSIKRKLKQKFMTLPAEKIFVFEQRR